MFVFRITKARYAQDLSGEGARLYGGRWNSKGTAVLYVAESRSLAAMELAVHVNLMVKPRNLVMLELEIPDALPVLDLPADALPLGWDTYPHPEITQKIGDLFVAAGEGVALKIPSVVIKGDHNYILNPLFPNYAEVRIKSMYKFDFDPRLGGAAS